MSDIRFAPLGTMPDAARAMGYVFVNSRGCLSRTAQSYTAWATRSGVAYAVHAADLPLLRGTGVTRLRDQQRITMTWPMATKASGPAVRLS